MLEDDQSESAKICNKLEIPHNSTINLQENVVELYVVDPIKLSESLHDAKLQLPENVRVIKVNELAKEVENIFGGLALSSCTSGFSVVNNNGIKGITTAGHCSDNQYYNGELLPWQGGTTGGDFDIQWHRGDHIFNVTNWIIDGAYGRSILDLKNRANQTVGSYVCKYGMTSGYGCAYIGSTTFNSVNVRVDYITVDFGDSGGPWFLSNTAYGTTIYSCVLSDGGLCAIYGPVDHIKNILNLTILTGKIYLPLVMLIR